MGSIRMHHSRFTRSFQSGAFAVHSMGSIRGSPGQLNRERGDGNDAEKSGKNYLLHPATASSFLHLLQQGLVPWGSRVLEAMSWPKAPPPLPPVSPQLHNGLHRTAPTIPQALGRPVSLASAGAGAWGKGGRLHTLADPVRQSFGSVGGQGHALG